MMTASTQAIVTAFEDLGLTPEQIVDASEGDYTISAVKSVLMQFSSKYRQACKAESPDETNFNFTDAERKEAKAAIVRLMRTSDDDHIVAKMATHIDNEQNRNFAARGMLGAGQINIKQIQLIINQGQEALKLTEMKRAKVADKEVKEIAA